ncbi:MAG TPA: hypothetical protein VGO37_00765 [Steroidobacteraceae bacterium]|jgi:ketosteroid isomerase-like protein|nr:hypothetical protein [Steroidobacteraceae bacterium]
MVKCTTATAAIRGLLQTEYAFSRRAHDSVKAAFLEYLAEDSLVLQPLPVPGREFYATANESTDKLEWYPAVVDLAGSGDLGFTTGPWTYTTGAGGQIHGHFLTIWKHDARCRWQVQFDGGVSHGAPANAEPKLEPDQISYRERSAPPQKLIADDGLSQAISDFQGTSGKDGFAAALRTYARTADFCFYTDGQAPLGLAASNHYLSDHIGLGEWNDDARGRSADSSLAYSVGVLSDAKRHNSYAYVQIWQYSPKAANWGLRILLFNPVAAVSK